MYNDISGNIKNIKISKDKGVIEFIFEDDDGNKIYTLAIESANGGLRKPNIPELLYEALNYV